jgi:ribonuclease R
LLARVQGSWFSADSLWEVLSPEERAELGGPEGLEALLAAGASEGWLLGLGGDRYARAGDLVLARFQASSGQSGYGFAIPLGGGQDLYIAPADTGSAWDGDQVLVQPQEAQQAGGSPRARVVSVLKRGRERLVGTVSLEAGQRWLLPDLARGRPLRLVGKGVRFRSGTRVIARLRWPEQTGSAEAEAEVEELLGDQESPETETAAVIATYGLRAEFPPELQPELDALLRKGLRVSPKRTDLRDRAVFTVDGADAKDFDDAIHIEVLGDGHFLVGVHIADVSHFVPEGSALDAEAYLRATSVYLPGKVLPMLPEQISNGLGSLVPGQDRLALSTLIELSPAGEVVGSRIVSSVIRSRARLTYDQVEDFSQGRSALAPEARALEGDLHLLLKLTTRLHQHRLNQGSLDFHLGEVRVEVGPGGQLDLRPIREETARGLIEDLMLLANRTVARYMLEHRIPALFRVHEQPSQERFQDVAAAMQRFGFSILEEQPSPLAYQGVLKQAQGTPHESVVSRLLLRSLKQARYAPDNLGHFGLAFSEYLHFTSPIRRYPDLLVHRALKLHLAGKLTRAAAERLFAALPAAAEHTSERERAAADAERDLARYYQAKWAQAHLSEAYSGRVSGVAGFGLFVALENGVEGLLHISALQDDYYVYVEESMLLRGRSRGRTYRLGDQLRVVIAQVNPLARQIDLALEGSTVDKNADTPKPRARRPGDRKPAPARQPATQTARPAQATQTARPAQTQGAPAGPRPASSPQPRGPRPEEPRNHPARHPRREHSGAQPQAAAPQARRVVTMERPKNEHLRPVSVTVQRLYFGDWAPQPGDLSDAVSPQLFRGSRRGDHRPQQRRRRR